MGHRDPLTQTGFEIERHGVRVLADLGFDAGCVDGSQRADHHEHVADDGDVGTYARTWEDAGGVPCQPDHARAGPSRRPVDEAGRDEHDVVQVQIDLVQRGPGAQVVVVGEVAVHQSLDEVAARPLLGLVHAALPEHLGADDRPGLFDDHPVLCDVVPAGFAPGTTTTIQPS